jgi:hypothetical protein
VITLLRAAYNCCRRGIAIEAGAAGVQINNIHGVIEDIVPSPLGYEITVDAGDHFFADITRREMDEHKYVTGEPVIVSFRPESLRLVGDGEEKKEY